MVDIPVNFVDGQELEAEDLNKMLGARTGDIKPIDDTTREYTDEAGDLGSPTYRYEKAYIGDLTIENNTITSSDGVVNAFGSKPADETGATLVVDISGATTTYYSATTGWYTCEIKGAGGGHSSGTGGTDRAGGDGGYIKDSFYVPYAMIIPCRSSSAGASGVDAAGGGGSSTIEAPNFLYITGGGAGGAKYGPSGTGGNGGHNSNGASALGAGGLGGESNHITGITSGLGMINSAGGAGRNNINTTTGGGGADATNGSIKLWKH